MRAYHVTCGVVKKKKKKNHSKLKKNETLGYPRDVYEKSREFPFVPTTWIFFLKF